MKNKKKGIDKTATLCYNKGTKREELIAMKKIICLTLAIICILTTAGCAKHILPNRYTKEECYIYEVNAHDGEVTIIDDNMQMWTFIDDTFNKSVGDACTVTMHDNGTPNNIYDDVIVSVK